MFIKEIKINSGLNNYLRELSIQELRKTSRPDNNIEGQAIFCMSIPLEENNKGSQKTKRKHRKPHKKRQILNNDKA